MVRRLAGQARQARTGCTPSAALQNARKRNASADPGGQRARLHPVASIKLLLLLLLLWLASAAAGSADTSSPMNVNPTAGTATNATAAATPTDEPSSAHPGESSDALTKFEPTNVSDAKMLRSASASRAAALRMPELKVMMQVADKSCPGLVECAASSECRSELGADDAVAPSNPSVTQLIRCVRNKLPSETYLKLRSSLSDLDELEVRMRAADKSCPGLLECAASRRNKLPREMYIKLRSVLSDLDHRTRLPWCTASFLQTCSWLGCECGTGLSCSNVASGGYCYRIPRELGNPCGVNQCGTWNDPAVPELKFELFCPLTGIIGLGGCSRSKPCAFVGGRDAELDRARLKLEDRAIALSKLVNAAKEKALQVAKLARDVYTQPPRRPKDTAKQVVWDAKVMALQKNIKEGRVSVKKLKSFKIEIDELVAEAKRIAVSQDKTLCGAIVKAANDIANWFRDAANDIVQWVNDNKCMLIPMLFTAIGTLGDLVLDGLSGGALASLQLQPWCLQYNLPSSLPLVGGDKVDVVGSGLWVLQKAACIITNQLGVKASALDDLCNGSVVALEVIQLILKAFCGKPASAVASIVGLSVACDEGCDNFLCPAPKTRMIGAAVDELPRYNATMSVKQLADKMVRDANTAAVAEVKIWNEQRRKNRKNHPPSQASDA
jgi:hypothetical protein